MQHTIMNKIYKSLNVEKSVPWYFKLKIYQAEVKRCQLPSIQMEINILKNSKMRSIQSDCMEWFMYVMGQ